MSGSPVDNFRSILAAGNDDVACVADFLERRRHCQWARRAYARAVFAFIEAMLWATKGFLMSIPVKQRHARLDDCDKDFLRTGKKTGKKENQRCWPTFEEDVTMTFQLAQKVLGASSIGALDDDANYKDLLPLKWDLRDRLAHPKTADAFVVQDEELESLENAICSFSGWLVKLPMARLERLLAEAKTAKATVEL